MSIFSHFSIKNKISCKTLFALFPLILIASTGISKAATVTWDGGAGTLYWSDSANWDGDTIPTDLDDVYVGTGNVIVLTSDAVASSLSAISAGNDMTLQITGTLTLMHEVDVHVRVGSASGYDTTLLVSDGGTLIIEDEGVPGLFSGMVIAPQYPYSGSTSTKGSMIVTDPGSTFCVDGRLIVGYQDADMGPGTGTYEGSLLVTNGGAVIVNDDGVNTYVAIGSAEGGIGDLTITGAGTTFDVDSLVNFEVGINGGIGTLTLADYGALTIGSNPLNIANGATSKGTVNIGAAEGDAPDAPGILDVSSIEFQEGDGTLIFNHTSNNYTFGEVITSESSGDGVIKALAGTTEFTADNSTFTGETYVSDSGNLIVSDILGGTTTVSNGGTLSGIGTLSTLNVISDGTVSPGNSIGTLNVDGQVSFASGSNYEVEIDSTTSDLISVTGTPGTASITGGNVLLSGYQNPVLTAGTTYTILTATNGVSGSGFDDILESFPFLSASLSYDPNNVYVTLSQDNTDLSSVGGRINQINTAKGIESLGAGNSIYDAIISQGSAEITLQAYQALSGELHANVKSSLLESQKHFGTVLANHLEEVEKKNDKTLWARVLRHWGDRDGDARAYPFKHKSNGFITGVDWMAGDDWRMGVAFGHVRSNYAQNDNTGAKGKAKQYSASIYGGRNWENVSVKTDITYIYSDIDTDRSVDFPSFSDDLEASYDAYNISASGELSYSFAPLERGQKIESFARANFGYVKVPEFTEKGGVAALKVEKSEDTLGTTTLGMRIQQTVYSPVVTDTPNDTPKKKATLRASAGWRHGIGNISPENIHSFDGSDPFTIYSSSMARDAMIIGLGMEFELGSKTSFSINYDSQIASDSNLHDLRGVFRYKF